MKKTVVNTQTGEVSLIDLSSEEELAYKTAVAEDKKQQDAYAKVKYKDD